LFFLMATGALLVKDLDRPDRFLNVLLRPQWKSWLVRGGYTISVFGGLMALLAVLMFFDLKGGFTPVLYGITLAAATMTAVYTAFLFAQAKGRDFWQSPSLALHMLVHSFMAGAAVFLIVNLITNEGIVWTDYLRNTLIIGLLVNMALMVLEFVTTHPTQEAKLTVMMILKGRYRNMFWIGAVLVGNVLPLVMLLLGSDAMLSAAASVLVMIGMYVTEKIWVEAPQRVQLV
jgi:formate-dependent nitrite reductase membrane component NrfD